MADHNLDYELDETLSLDRPEQYKALFEDTRIRIVDLLLERAATIKDLSEALDKPKGTIGHHVSVLEEAGLIKLVRTEKVRAIEAKYYGRVARTFLLSKLGESSVSLAPAHFFTTAAAEYSEVMTGGEPDDAALSTLRYARIPRERADEWERRLIDLSVEFSGQPREGDTTYGLMIGLYPTDRPGLPETEPS